MQDRIRRILALAPLVGFVLILSHCGSPESRGAQRHNDGEGNLPAPSSPTTSQKAAEAKYENNPASTEVGSYSIQYQFPPERKLYYVIENNFTDRGGVPPLLSYSAHADDKRTIIQSVTTQPVKPPAPAASGQVSLTWQIDRYEAREHGIKDEVKFDSIRDSYARAEIRELGKIPGATVTFNVNPRTGVFDNVQVDPRKDIGPPTRRRLSRTVQRLSLTPENVAKLLDDFGPLFLPNGPVKPGDTWTTTRSEVVKSFGETFFDYRFTLRSIKKAQQRDIAVIDVAGATRLVPEQPAPEPTQPVRPPPAHRTAATRPTQQSPRGPTTLPAANTPRSATTMPVGVTRPAAPPATPPVKRASTKPKDFKIDKSVCRGVIEFDITRGELVSIDLSRELDLSAGVESEEIKNMRLETGWAHRLAVRVTDSPPPKPIIAGGPKPPADDPAEPAASNARRKRPPPRSNKGITSQPHARPRYKPYGQTTTQPGARPRHRKLPNRYTPQATFVGPPFLPPGTRTPSYPGVSPFRGIGPLQPYRPPHQRPVPSTQPMRHSMSRPHSPTSLPSEPPQ
ncbi:MAG TPA: hypothetical protein VNT79_13310 [Phycisphaerae bacterium]|nr:hypothetical protein [Phycisphaerae bacterium]